MIEQKDQVIIISCCVVLVIVVGLLLTFFGSFINQVNTQKYTSKIKTLWTLNYCIINGF